MSYIEDEIARHDREVYGGTMSARAKSVLRDMLTKDARFCEREWVHEELQAKHGEERSRDY